MTRLMRTGAATLVALGIAGLLPLAALAQTIGFKERTQTDFEEVLTSEHLKCMRMDGRNHLKLTSDTSIPNGTEVTYVVRTVEGHDMFRNHGVQAWLAPGSNLSELPGNVITARTSGSGTEVYLPGLCWADNLIDGSRPPRFYSVIEVSLVSVSGFSIDFGSHSARYVIADNDVCDRIDLEPKNNNGIVYQIRNGRSCVCAKKSTVVQAGIDDGETESYATTALNWRTDSTNYCPDSPYQRPRN